MCVFIHIDAIRGGFERSVESCRRVEDSELYIVEKRLGVPVFRPASGRHEKRQTAVRRLRGEGLKNWCLSPVSVAPSARCCFFLVFLTTVDLPYTLYTCRRRGTPVFGGPRGVVVDMSDVVSLRDERDKTLSGGSLGSCVDEERSQLREVM